MNYFRIITKMLAGVKKVPVRVKKTLAGMKKMPAGVAVACCLTLFSACYKATVSPAGAHNGGDSLLQPLQSILENNADFHDFDTLLKRSGLYERITAADSTFTLLVPDNQAFASAGLSPDSLLLWPVDSLKAFIGYHILPGVVTTAVVPQSITNPFLTLSGQTLYCSKPLLARDGNYQPQIAIDMKTLNVNGINTKQVDVAASNGVVQVLAAPLSLPYPSIQAFLAVRPEYSYLVAALKKFDLWNQLDSAGPYTLFAPDNDAFINNNVTMDMINSDTFDVRHYEPYLLSAGIVPGRIFSTDFHDAPAMSNGQPLYSPAIYSVYGSVNFPGVDVYSYSFPGVVVLNWVNPYGYGYNQIGGNPQYTLTNQPAVNGVINGVNDLLVYPDNVHLPQ